MKNIRIIGALAVTVTLLLSACTNETGKGNTMETKEKTSIKSDEDAINQVLEDLFAGADARDWNRVSNTMYDSVYVDYSALGGMVGFKEPKEIVDSWEAFLPGFDRTVHQVHNQAIWVAGSRASATFDAIATHFLETDEGEDHWTVFVGYDTEYVKANGKWKIARIDLSLYDQVGNTSLPGQALEVIKNDLVNPLAQESNAKNVVEQFFSALEQTNFDALISTLDQDVKQHMPLAPSNFPKVLEGLEAMNKQYKGVMEYDQKYNRSYFPTSNPNALLVKFDGTITTNEGKAYNNSYVNLYEVENGKIKSIVELFNPNILLNGWPGLQPATYSMHDAGARTDSGVKREKVVFNSNGVNLTGHLFYPPTYESGKQYPAAIVTGSWTSVKEQMPDEYASLLARDGLITLTFDFTGFGESEGQPRQVEDYNLKIADINAAVDYLTSLSSVDESSLSGLGVCASSGYMAHATAQDPRIKQLVLVAPWLHNPEIAKSIYDLRPGGTEGLLASAKEAKKKYAETGEMEYVLGASELDPLSAMYVPQNAFDYYLNPAKAAGKVYDNRFAVSSWEPWLTFDGISAGKEIKQPVFIVHSESGAVPHGAKEFYNHLEGEKDIVWLNDYNQQDLYYVEEAVHNAMGEVVKYLKR